MARYKVINSTHVRRLVHEQGKRLSVKGIRTLEDKLIKTIKNSCEAESKKTVDFSQQVFLF